MIFDEVVPPGTLLFMTMEANFGTQHGVPEVEEEVGLSGSIVFRTVKDRRSVQRIQKEADKVYAGRASKGIRKKRGKKSKKSKKSKKPRILLGMRRQKLIAV